MSYPSNIDTFVEKIDRNLDGVQITDEIGTIPSSSSYEFWLYHVPKDPTSSEIWSGPNKTGTEFAEITTGDPAANQFIIDYVTGKVTFSSANAGQIIYINYLTLGDTIMASHANALQDAIENLQNTLGTVPGGTKPTGVVAGIIDSSGVIKGNTYLGTQSSHFVDVYGYLRSIWATSVRVGTGADPFDLSVSRDAFVERDLRVMGSTEVWQNLSVFGDASLQGNVFAGGNVSAMGNISTESLLAELEVRASGVVTSHSIDASGNVYTSDIVASGNIYPSGNIIPFASGQTNLGSTAKPMASGYFDKQLRLGKAGDSQILEMWDTGTSTFKKATLTNGVLGWS